MSLHPLFKPLKGQTNRKREKARPVGPTINFKLPPKKHSAWQFPEAEVNAAVMRGARWGCTLLQFRSKAVAPAEGRRGLEDLWPAALSQLCAAEGVKRGEGGRGFFLCSAWPNRDSASQFACNFQGLEARPADSSAFLSMSASKATASRSKKKDPRRRLAGRRVVSVTWLEMLLSLHDGKNQRLRQKMILASPEVKLAI